jgi:hypothetical protein
MADYSLPCEIVLQCVINVGTPQNDGAYLSCIIEIHFCITIPFAVIKTACCKDHNSMKADGILNFIRTVI